ncbi:ABC transporter substrate-binding protein [Paenibacillus sp. JDR-2]|uniref:ABC transporter substrate-binding protein n=1 Tax=Paenibacillus sp. (strain JDR-2) TaxID=324057 RepID=UPI0001AAF8CF|nr:extracellular solute-binding protein [Paenibacillus sp. JDR-2]ACT02310.1 extracellular solute-binding protein family 1 [Paenibacillus sp. JDR-2]
MAMGKRAAVVLVGLTVMLSACSQGNGNNGNNSSETTNAGATPAATQSTDKKPVTLKVLVASDWLKEKKWQMIFDDYEQQTGNKLDIQSAPVNSYKDLVNTRLATQDAPDLLFYWSQAGAISQLQPEKNLLDLSNEEFVSRINPAVSKYFLKSKDKLYGIPVTGLSVGGVLYNKKVFSDLGIEIPTTYEEFLAACEKIKAAGITPIYEAGKEGWPLQIFSFDAMANVINKQPDLMDKLNARQVTYDQVPEFVDVLQRQSDLQKSGYVNKDLFSATYDMSLEQVATGKSAMIFQADWAVSPLLEKYSDAQIGMFPLPADGDSYAAISDPNGLYVLKNSKNVDAAKDFLNFFSSQEELTKYFNEVKSIPTWTGLSVDLNPGTSDMNTYVESGKAVPFFNALSIIDIGDYQSILQQLYGGQLSAEGVAKSLQSNIDKGAKAAGIAGF